MYDIYNNLEHCIYVMSIMVLLSLYSYRLYIDVNKNTHL